MMLKTMELGWTIWPATALPSAITPATGAISASGSRRDLSIDARRSRSPSSSSRVSSSWVRDIAPDGASCS